MLKCQTSEDLGFIPDNTVDTVVTDPPYYDNIMYSELSDFFYVWLRNQLKHSYPSTFDRNSSNDADEILVYTKTGKDANFFINSMIRVYGELHRVMKDDAKLVFVYQHKRIYAWTAMLRILVYTGFSVEAVYPTHGETPSGVRAHGINYNALLVCRKMADVVSRAKRTPRDAAFDSVESIRAVYDDKKESQSIMLKLGKALQAYTQFPTVRDGRITDDCVEDFESFVKDYILG